MAGLVAWAKSLCLDWKHFPIIAGILLLADTAFSTLVLYKVPYTEIDWIAYMQEVEGWVVEGHTDYLQLKGDTGPLVYPAGFMYIFAGLRHLCGNGGRGAPAIWIAQLVFLGVYLATQVVVFLTYNKARIGSPWVLVLLLVSKRVHSLYFLRLFNDCVEMLFVHVAIYAFVNRKWLAGTVLLSLGLSIKMNALLFVPGLLYLLARNVGMMRMVGHVAVMVLLQVVIGAPFLFAFPNSYLSKAFELSRVFFHQWTVNLKFLPEEIFISKPVALLLLGGHLGFLIIFAAFKWSSVSGGLLPVLQAVGLLPEAVPEQKAVTRAQKEKAHLRGSDSSSHSFTSRLSSAAYTDSPAFILYVLYTSNFIGIVFSRTMHYQFYTWYFHTIPLLLAAATSLPWVLRLVAFAGIEYAFNVGDATGAGSPLSSAILQAAHFLVFAGLLSSSVPSATAVKAEEATIASKKQR